MISYWIRRRINTNMCSLTRVVLLDSSCFQTCAHTNSVIITQFWKWGVNEDKMKMKKKKSWSTIVNWPPFTPLPSPIIAYISFFCHFILYIHTHTHIIIRFRVSCQKICKYVRTSVWQWAICIKRKLIKNLFCLLPISPDVHSRLTCIQYTRTRKHNYTRDAVPPWWNHIYIHIYI